MTQAAAPDKELGVAGVFLDSYLLKQTFSRPTKLKTIQVIFGALSNLV